MADLLGEGLHGGDIVLAQTGGGEADRAAAAFPDVGARANDTHGL